MCLDLFLQFLRQSAGNIENKWELNDEANFCAFLQESVRQKNSTAIFTQRGSQCIIASRCSTCEHCDYYKRSLCILFIDPVFAKMENYSKKDQIYPSFARGLYVMVIPANIHPQLMWLKSKIGFWLWDKIATDDTHSLQELLPLQRPRGLRERGHLISYLLLELNLLNTVLRTKAFLILSNCYSYICK